MKDIHDRLEVGITKILVILVMLCIFNANVVAICNSLPFTITTRRERRRTKVTHLHNAVFLQFEQGNI